MQNTNEATENNSNFKLHFNHPIMEVFPFLKCREDIDKIRLLVIKDYPKYASCTNAKGKIIKPPMPNILFLKYGLYYYDIITNKEFISIMSEEEIKKTNTGTVEFGL